jgi:hypothetical protein
VRLWRRLLGEPASTTGVAVSPREPGESDLAHLTRLAQGHLSPEVAQRWLGLLRPAVRRLQPHGGAPVVARLGGSPRLPADTPWPTWEGHGPLSFIGELDLAALASLDVDLDLPLPTAGRLAFFFFDGAYDDHTSVVGSWDPDSLAGARVLHLSEDGEVRAAPDRVPVFAERLLTARQVTTAPTWEHPALRRAFGRPGEDHASWMRHPVNAEPFTDAVDAVRGDPPRHQVGGWADAVQGPVELEVAHAALRLGDDWDDPRLGGEAERWTLLLQVDSDGDMEWGDVGTLYWLVREDDLAAGALERASFTWQCS